MEDPGLPPLLWAIFDKLSSPIFEEYGLLWVLVKAELENLRTTLLNIQRVLQDAEEEHVTGKAVRIWLGELRDAAYDADDLLDEFKTEALRHKQGRRVTKVRDIFLPSNISNPIVWYKIKEVTNKLDAIARQIAVGVGKSPYKAIQGRSEQRRMLPPKRGQVRVKICEDVIAMVMAHKKKEMTNKLDANAMKRLDYGSTVGVGSSHFKPIQRQSESTGSFLIESKIYGRDEDKEKIVELLISRGNQERLSIIPIVGMGGIGKTTLAKLAYKDHRVLENFDLRMWIQVSDRFHEQNLRCLIMNKVLESITEHKFDLSNMDILQSRLHNNLPGKRFLLVLDDVWIEDHTLSERLKNILRCGAEGSKIIVTTRSQNVASIWGTVKPYYLNLLSADDSWMLLKQRAFAGEREEGIMLVQIGKEIAKKCEGLPLAAKTLGSLLHFKRDEEWLELKDSEIWNISRRSSEFLPALWLIYNYLPPQLKHCFAYSAFIGESICFQKDNLIQQWMAQGFIEAQMEDTGTKYFNDLVCSSLIEVEEKDYDGNVTKWRMHDLVSHLARFVAGDECLDVVVNWETHIPIRTRHLLLRAKSVIPDSLLIQRKLRTLVFSGFGENTIKEVPEKIFILLKYLRVLDLSGTGIKSLSSSIDKLKHLRYLNLSGTDIQALPHSICSLLHLQTLNLSGCGHLQELPKDMWMMISLRHLNINGCDLLNHIPTMIRQLSCLQTLPMFIVCKDNECCSLTELKSLNLGGDLYIKKLKNVKNAVDAEEANLKEKHHLRKLRLSWDDDGEANLTDNVEQVMEGLRPHPNLQRLQIEDYGGANFPSWMMDLQDKNLVEISLINCKNCQQLPPFGQLHFLKILIVKQMDAVKCGDGTPEGLFSSLEQVTFEEMPNLEKWWGVFPHLAKLTIKNCHKLMTLPDGPSLERLELQGINSSAIRSVANFKSLSFLSIHGFLETCLPIGFLPKLHTLTIVSCPNLILLHLENLKTLKVIHIKCCSNLFSIVDVYYLEQLTLFDCERLIRNFLTKEKTIRGLAPLKNLSINECPNLKFLPEGIQRLTALQMLHIGSCPNLESFPEGLQHITTLQSLSIIGCDKLVSLPEWLGNLASLRFLLIEKCPHIMSLPMELLHLTALQEFVIKECPHLEERCKKHVGEDWYKIAHVPCIFINARKVP